MKSMPVIIFLIILALIFAILVLLIMKKIKEVMAWQKRAIRKITEKGKNT